MQIPYSQQRLLRRIERRLRRSDPRLAAMLAIFAQLYASEVLASPEQRARARWIAWLRGAVARLAVVLSACAGTLFRAARAAGRITRGRLGAVQHSSAQAG
jgi:Protein of unknown function (DUF3040)